MHPENFHFTKSYFLLSWGHEILSWPGAAPSYLHTESVAHGKSAAEVLASSIFLSVALCSSMIWRNYFQIYRIYLCRRKHWNLQLFLQDSQLHRHFWKYELGKHRMKASRAQTTLEHWEVDQNFLSWFLPLSVFSCANLPYGRFSGWLAIRHFWVFYHHYYPTHIVLSRRCLDSLFSL